MYRESSGPSRAVHSRIAMSSSSSSTVIGIKDILQAVANDDESAFKYRQIVENVGAPVNQTYYEAGQGTAAHIAAKYGNLEIIKYALEKDPAILGYRDDGGNTIFFIAVQNGHIDIVKYLVEKHNANICERDRRPSGNTGIHQACEYGHLAILKYFVEEKNVDVDITNNFDQPPVFIAVLKKHYPIIMYLAEERMADLTMLDHKNNNILFIAIDADDLGIMKYILDKMRVDIDLSHQNLLGDTIVSHASLLGRLEILKYIVGKKKINVNTRDISNKTALHGAARKNHFKICKYLVEKGANIYAEGEDGKLPVNEATNTRLITFLEKEAKNRERRSVSDFPPCCGPNQTISIPCPRTRDITETSNPVVRLDGEIAVRPDDGGSLQFQNFFIMGYMFRSRMGERTLRKNIILSPPELLRDRMDPIAVDASLKLHVN